VTDTDPARLAIRRQVERAGDIMRRLTEVLNASGEFWVQAKEVDGTTDVRLEVSDLKKGGPWFTLIAETDDDEET
jgi:hypothetical protein